MRERGTDDGKRMGGWDGDDSSGYAIKGRMCTWTKTVETGRG